MSDIKPKTGDRWLVTFAIDENADITEVIVEEISPSGSHIKFEEHNWNSISDIHFVEKLDEPPPTTNIKIERS